MLNKIKNWLKAINKWQDDYNYIRSPQYRMKLRAQILKTKRRIKELEQDELVERIVTRLKEENAK